MGFDCNNGNGKNGSMQFPREEHQDAIDRFINWIKFWTVILRPDPTAHPSVSGDPQAVSHEQPDVGGSSYSGGFNSSRQQIYKWQVAYEQLVRRLPVLLLRPTNFGGDR
ncbi:unnamed protein product [Citrullus colocynthis]|uniref:Uncharacterized protein n=1 Tax=Citrullus colocynthis TaxID=252529 RepID=A0ABP0YRW3_9ROSI